MTFQDWQHATKNWQVKLDADEWFFTKLRESFIEAKTPVEAWSELRVVGAQILIEPDVTIRGELGTLLLALAIRSEATELPEELDKDFSRILEVMCNSGFNQESDELRRWFRR